MSRLLWERDVTVELCVDGADVVQMFGYEDPVPVLHFLEDLSAAGVSSVGAYWDPGFRLRERLEEWDPRLPFGMTVTLRPEAAPFTDWQPRWTRMSRSWGRGPEVRNVLFAGPSVLGFPDLSSVAQWISSSSYHLPWMEFSRQRGMADLARRFPERLIRGHTVSEDEIAQTSPTLVVARFRRAVRERGARFLYIRLFPGLGHPANRSFVRSLARSLRADGYRLAPAEPRGAFWPRPILPLTTAVRQALALLLAIGGPWVGLLAALRRWPSMEAPARLTLVTLAASVGVSALLASPEFLLGVEVFRGVKAALVLPLVAAVFLLFRANEIRHFLEEPITVGRLGFGLLALGILGVYVVRSGHDALAASGVELSVRGTLESWLGVRPRFKEFLFGHPLLLLGFYLRARGAALRLPSGHRSLAQALHFIFHDPRPFLLAGFIGQLSILNTFCHAHTPLAVSFLRTFHGLWIGGVFGAALILGVRWAESRWDRLP